MNKALILIDIQNYYFEYGAMPLVGSLEASENAEKIINKFRQEGSTVIHIHHIAVGPDATFFSTKYQRSGGS